VTAWGSGEVTVVVDTIPHVVNLLGPRTAGQVSQSVVMMQAGDELTDLPVSAPITVSTSVDGLVGQSASGGVAGLVGVPTRALPRLDTQAYLIDITVSAAGYLPWTSTVTVPIQATFPAAFSGLNLGPVRLRRSPVTLEITTLSLDAQNRLQPLAGVDVSISRVWRRLVDLSGAGVATTMIGFPLGVSQDWPAGTAVDSVSLVPAAEPVRRLTRGAAPGEEVLAVDGLGALAVADLVGLDLADVSRREYLAVGAVAGSTDPSSPAVLDLTGPVRVAHAQSSTVRRVPAPPTGPPDATLTEAARSGDVTVFVDTVAPFASVEILRASDATITGEYLDGHLFRASSNAAGFARILALSRVAAVELTASLGPLNTTSRFTPDYSTPTNSVALVLR
jgi:hypothetical protein